jgi:ATP-binding cassette subfamily B protein
MTKQRSRVLIPRKYNLWDCIRLPFCYIPFHAAILVLNKLLHALLPALLVVVTASFIDTALAVVRQEQLYSAVIAPLALLAVIIIFQWTADSFMNFVDLRIGMRLRLTLRAEIFEKRAAVAYKHIENAESLDLMSRVIQEPEEDMMDGFHTLFGIIQQAVRAAAVLAMFALQVWWAALVIIAVTAPLYFLSVGMGKKSYGAKKECSKYDRRAGYLAGVLHSRDAVLERTLFGYADKVGRQFVKDYEIARILRRKVERRNFIIARISSLFGTVISITIMAALIQPVRSGAITIGMFIALVMAGQELAGLLQWGINYQIENLARRREFFKDLSVFASYEETPGGLDAPDWPPVAFESLEFRNVRFKYPGMEHYVLDGMSFKIEKDRHYALVGINGSGKTTITKLITGLYDDFEGEILINGQPINEYRQGQLKSLCSVVFQDFAKYAVTLRDNIKFGRAAGDGCTDAEFEKVLKFINLDEASTKLTKGVDTPLGKIKSDGVDLSGGEWQRVAMARSMMSTAPLKILDEPTASLDPLSESRVYSEFEELSRGKTTLFISHRLGSTKLADVILVIGSGRLIETGSHDELMSSKGLYAEMYDSQRSWYE